MTAGLFLFYNLLTHNRNHIKMKITKTGKGDLNMEFKQMMKKSAEIIGETAQLVTDKVMDKDFRERVAGTVAEASMSLADATVRTIKKTRNYAEENHLTIGSKDKYIEQLEAELEAKNREIRMLKKKLQKKNWNGR